MSSSPTVIDGYLAGTWKISPVNSEVRFTVRHLGVTTVHGRFNAVAGTIVTGDTLAQSSVTATIAADSIDTGFGARDAYIRGDDVLAAKDHTELRFTSNGVRAAARSLLVDGALTLRDVTKPVTWTVKVGGFAHDPVENVPVLGLSAMTTLRRADFGLAAKIPAFVVAEAVGVHLDIHATGTAA